MTELSDLPPKERARRYRQLAVDAEVEGRRALGAARQSYELLAAHWRKLADELETKLRDAEPDQGP
jgi:hypothetical protein